MRFITLLSKGLLTIALVFLPVFAHADVTTDVAPDGESNLAVKPGGVTSLKTPAPGNQPSVFGFFETRPSYTSVMGEFHTENTAEVGYQPKENMKFSYLQYFNTNVYNPKQIGNFGQGLSVLPQDGFFRVKIADIWKSHDGNTAFSFQGRAYLPTLAQWYPFPSRADQGMVTLLRPYLTLSHDFNSVLTGVVAYVPSLYFFDKPGYVGLDGSLNANPWFEHLFILEADVKISKRVSLSLPVIGQFDHYRSWVAGSSFSGGTSYWIYIWPELDIDIGSGQTIGAAFYSDTFINMSGSGARFKEALQNGVAQVIWNVKI